MTAGSDREPSDEWSGDIRDRFNNWAEQFYEENLFWVLERAIRAFGKELVEDLVTKLTRLVLQMAAEQIPEGQIEQFLAAVAAERRYEEVQQFCRQIAECQQIWSLLTELGERDGAHPS